MSGATPLAASAARQLKRELGAVTGSGPGGRVRLADMISGRALQAQPLSPALKPGARGAVAKAVERQRGQTLITRGRSSPRSLESGVRISLGDEFPDYREAALSPMRRAIAERVQESKRSAPHYYLSMDVTVDALIDMREELNRWLSPRLKLSMNDLYVKLVATTLQRHRDLNAAWLGDAIAVFDQVDLAVAVSIEGGLVTPVLRNASAKGLKTIATELGALIDGARARTLPGEALRGGTFTVSNLGMYGVREFAAIINPPQAAILAVAGVRREVTPDDTGSGRIVRRTTLTLSVDHRVADGAAGAEFLSDLRACIEEPRRLIL